MHNIAELRELQALPMYIKVGLTKNRIREWVHKMEKILYNTSK